MDLFSKLSNDPHLIESFCDILEEYINVDIVYRSKGTLNVNITYRISPTSIFFFIGGSSILQIMPYEEQYTYANVPGFGNEVKKSIDMICLQINRDDKIEKILSKKKES